MPPSAAANPQPHSVSARMHAKAACRSYATITRERMVRMKGGKGLGVVLIVAAAAAGAGAVSAPAVQSNATAARVNVRLVEFKVIPSVKRVAAGRVTFVVRNAGKIPHEFVVLKTKTPAGKLPVRSGKAVETGKVGKIPVFRAGVTKKLTLTLKRGHYALICNVPGHYKAGQFVDFTVR